MRARVVVRLKSDVLDPQGEATQRGLSNLGIDGISNVRIGKVIEMEVAGTREQVMRLVAQAAEQLLVNPVMETCTIETDAENSPAALPG